jgi:hypothetical protein
LTGLTCVLVSILPVAMANKITLTGCDYVAN